MISLTDLLKSIIKKGLGFSGYPFYLINYFGIKFLHLLGTTDRVLFYLLLFSLKNAFRSCSHSFSITP